MNIANTYLYYPLIRIPEETLIYSLLYKDKIKRIIGMVHIPVIHSKLFRFFLLFNILTLKKF